MTPVDIFSFVCIIIKKHKGVENGKKKKEEVYGQTYETVQEVKSSLFEYIEIFYTLKGRN
ncbi:MAG: IS3 family transposase [Desulfobacteraceae bacterium]|nr:IS3 family transposase [Desulfobacteraceae bacterium]